MQSELKHLEGMPPFLMMQMEARLKVRIREIHTLPPDILTITDKKVDDLARHILHRLMEQRMNEGRKFDSILAASTKAFGHMLINNILEEAKNETSASSFDDRSERVGTEQARNK